MKKQDVNYEKEFLELLKKLPDNKKKEILYILQGYSLASNKRKKVI